MSVEPIKKLTYKSDDPFYDQSKRAAAVLDHILYVETDKQVAAQTGLTGEVSVDDALKERPILDRKTGRQSARVLFVTTDVSIFETDSAASKGYLQLAKLFDEVHVLVLINRVGKDAFLRAAQNTWFYQVHAKNWQELTDTAVLAARDALTWNNIIRPDIVVGIDPFEAGVAAYRIAQDFGRPFQLHLKTDFIKPSFLDDKVENKERLPLADWLLNRTKSLRTNTNALGKVVASKYKKIIDIKTLPHFYNFSGLSSATPSFNLHDKYRDFAFIMVTFCELKADSHLHDLFSALRRILLNPRIGLVVVGDGPAKDLFIEKVKLLGIQKNVVFVRNIDDLPAYFKTTDLFIELDVSEEAEVRVLQAAAAGAAILTYETDLRKDLFVDGTSAFLCPVKDIQCVGQKVNKFINTSALKRQLQENAKNIAAERLHENPENYYYAFRDTVESVLKPFIDKQK